MRNIYPETAAVIETRPTAKALGAAIGSKNLVLLLFFGLFMLVSGKSMSQGNVDPSITSVNTNCALQGQDVTLTITGTNFRSNNSDGASRVIINNTSILVPTSITSTSIVVFVPKSLITSSSFLVKVRQKGTGQTEDETGNIQANLISLTAIPGQSCATGQVTLSVNATGLPLNSSYRWYNSSLQQVGTGNSYTTPVISSTTTYYVSAVTGSCETSPVPVVATIGGVTPEVTGDRLCNTGKVTLRASGAPAGGVYRWYGSSDSTTPLFTGPVYQPDVDATKTYYVQIENTACANPRVPVVATIGSINPPTVSATVNCNANGAQVITFYAGGARNASDVYTWYDSNNTVVGTGESIERSTNQNSGLHYVVIRSSTCTSERTYLQVPANNNLTPATPANITAERCASGSLTINATPELGMNFKWYSPAGIELSEGNSFTIQAVNSGTTTYTYRKVNYATGCISAPATVTVTGTNPISARGDILPPPVLAENMPATFTFDSNILSNEIERYQWYYHEVGSPANVWVQASNGPTQEFERMPGNIDGFRLELTIREQNAACYSNLLTNRVFLVNDLPITPLPVELISFNAQRHTQGVNLTWVTASELDNKGFEVQVSTDSRNFTSIGFVESKVGTTSLKQYYNFLDTKAVSGTRYYRLKQIDFDGTTSFSAIRAVALNGNNGVVAAYPNPFDDVVTVTLNGTEARQVQIVLVDVMGKILLQRTEETAGNSISVDMTNITTKGMYLLHVLDNNAKHTFKLMKR